MAATNPESLKVVKEYPRREAVFALERVPDTRRLIFGGSDFKVYELDLAADKPEARELGAHDSYVTGLGLALGGTQAVSGGYDGRLIWWDLERRAKVRAVDAHTKWIRGVAGSPDGKTIASVADDMVCRLWDAGSGTPRHELRGHAEMTPHGFPSMLFACAFTPDGRHLATGDKVGHIVVWEVESGKSVATLEAPGLYTWDPVQRRHSIGGIRSLAFSPDGEALAVGGVGKINNVDHLEGKARIEVFRWRKAERTHEIVEDKFKGLVERLEFHPAGDWLLGAGGANDGFLTFYDLKTKAPVAQEKAPMHVHDVVFDESSGTLFTAGHAKIAVFEMKG
jgi:WD40 repeat protein